MHDRLVKAEYSDGFTAYSHSRDQLPSDDKEFVEEVNTVLTSCLKSSSTNSEPVRTGTDNFTCENRFKAATERTGGAEKLKELMGGVASKTYLKYRYNIYPKIDHIRGTTKISGILENQATYGIPKISEEEVTPVTDLEWDNLIILDACRYDTFQEVIGDAEKRVTVGSHSSDYFQKTYSEGDYSDWIYISANPHTEPGIFNDLTGRSPEDVFNVVFQTFQSKWSEEEGTVMPEKVVEDAKTAEKLYPDQRKVIHFMQPHHPFLTSDLSDAEFSTLVSDDGSDKHEWLKAINGSLTHQQVTKAYKENLEYVWRYVKQLSEALEGKTLVTSDHGNFLGENGLYGHIITGSKARPVREVPVKEVHKQ